MSPVVLKPKRDALDFFLRTHTVCICILCSVFKVPNAINKNVVMPVNLSKLKLNWEQEREEEREEGEGE